MIEKPPTHEKITRRIAVSQTVADGWYELTGEKADVIYNPFVLDEPKRVLTLISPTRLSSDKGKHRMIELANMLEEKNIPYIWYIFTDDTDGIDNPHMVYMKPTLDIGGWIQNADYLVQLSNAEGYCYSVVESLKLGTPVIVTDMPVIHEVGVIDGKNGFIVDFEMKNVDIDKIYNSRLTFEYEPKNDSWDKELAKGKSTYEFKETELLVKNDVWKPKNKKVSVIIPVYNQEDLVIRALDSIPDREDIEIIVINDASDDNTQKNLINYDYRHGNDKRSLIIYNNNENKGVGLTKNVGLDNATGEYIVELDSDDYFYTEAFNECIDELDGTDIVYFNLRTNDGTVFRLTNNTKTNYCGNTKFIRRNFIADTRYDDLKACEDYYYYNELLKKKPTEKFTDILVKHYNYPRENSLSWKVRNGVIKPSWNT